MALLSSRADLSSDWIEQVETYIYEWNANYSRMALSDRNDCGSRQRSPALHIRHGAYARYKQYLDEMKGVALQMFGLT